MTVNEPSGVLARIDAAIDRWESGPDAARWNPGVPESPPAQRVLTAGPAQEQMAAAFNDLGRRITEQWAAMTPVLTAAFEQIAKNVTAAGLALQKLGFAVHFQNGARACPHRTLYEACDFCYPKPFPAARDYRRRTRHRNRRRKS